LTAIAAIVLLVSGGYKRLERVTTVLVAMVTLLTVACVVALSWTDYRVSAAGLAEGFRFALPTTGIALAFGAFGITGVGASELFAYPYWCLEKGYARAAGPRSQEAAWAQRARGWLRVMQLDAWVSMVVFTVATVAFYLLGAAVLHPQGIHPEGRDMLRALSRMYLPLGTWTVPVFLIGAWAVLFKTLYVATAANSRLTADLLALAGVWRRPTPAGRERVIKAFCVFYPSLAVVLYFASPEAKGLVQIGGIAQALMLPLIGGATLYLRYRDTDPRLAPRRLTDVLTWVAFVSVSAFAAYSLWDLGT
jgi:Mn2+/Fe2+ NRAMP family transporter